MATSAGEDPGRGAASDPDESACDPLASTRARERAADIALAAAIAEVNYDLTHQRCRLLLPQLAALGAGTLINFWCAGTLFKEVARRGLGRLGEPPPTWPESAREFLEDVAWSTAPRFIERSLPRWSPTGGASIASFFVNATFFEFKKRYVPFARAEWHRYQREAPMDFRDTNMHEMVKASADVENTVLNRQTLAEALSKADPTTVRPILQLMSEGCTHEEIAKRLGISVNTVGRRLAAYRRILESRGWSTGNGGR